MCVAAVIFKPVPLSDMEMMDSDNPHGAGVAWQRGNKIAFKRGLDAKQIFEMQESGELTYPYLMHYRWATHGEKVGELTHPFPLGVRALFGELEGECESVLIHNGTWNRAWNALVGVPGVDDLPPELFVGQSDTSIAAYLAQNNEAILDQVQWATVVAFMKDGALDFTVRGSFSEHNDNWYSNLNWLPGTGYMHLWGMDADDYRSSVIDYLRAKPRKPTYPSHSAWDPAYDYASNPYKVLDPETDTREMPEFNWEDYLRAKYGEDVAQSLTEGGAESYEDLGNLVSDDPRVVAAAIAEMEQA